MGRTALVTGGSRGIGAAVVKRLEATGVRVLAPPRTELDLASPASIDAWLSKAPQPIDILVNNAGINRLGASDEVTAADLAETLQVDLVAPFRLSAALGQAMKARRWGRIVQISSIWGRVARERRVSYAAAKSGLEGFTRALAVELGGAGVLVNAVAPGYVDTELTRKNNSPEEIQKIEGTIPLGRLGSPAEIAECVAFLCSEENAYMTGQVLVVDGGFTCT